MKPERVAERLVVGKFRRDRVSSRIRDIEDLHEADE